MRLKTSSGKAFWDLVSHHYNLIAVDAPKTQLPYLLFRKLACLKTTRILWCILEGGFISKIAAQGMCKQNSEQAKMDALNSLKTKNYFILLLSGNQQGPPKDVSEGAPQRVHIEMTPPKEQAFSEWEAHCAASWTLLPESLISNFYHVLRCSKLVGCAQAKGSSCGCLEL